jgi:RNA polymerase sigma-70 factor (ECF subfamily)
VHEEHAEFVWNSLHRLGVRDSDLEDLLQEVFVVVHQRQDTFDQEAPMRPWLFGICRKVAAAHRRLAQVRREQPHAAVPEMTAEGPDDDPEHGARVREGRAMLDRILNELDCDARVVFVMFEIEELPLKEIAATLGIPRGTVSSRLRAARHAFERALARVSRGTRHKGAAGGVKSQAAAEPTR